MVSCCICVLSSPCYLLLTQTEAMSIVCSGEDVSRPLPSITTTLPVREALESLILGTDLGAYLGNARVLLELTPARDAKADEPTVLSTVRTIGEAFKNLRHPSQTRTCRRAQLTKYHDAVCGLRAALAAKPLSHNLVIPIFLFALYEVCLPSV